MNVGAMQSSRRLVVGITGASGFIYGARLLELLRPLDIEVHVAVSRAAQLTMAYETSYRLPDVKSLADVWHKNDDVGACIASGSYRTMGMVIAPCSMKTLAEIAAGQSTSLMTRAADVVLKERKALVLMARETPLTLAHLRNMVSVTEMGAIVAPPVPAFYACPGTLDDMIVHTLGRVLDVFNIELPTVKRWNGTGMARAGLSKSGSSSEIE